MDSGEINIVCQKCGAMVWYVERTEKHFVAVLPKISLCCMKGKITLPYMLEPPALIRNLFSRLDAHNSHFLTNIRSYNNMFAFTYMESKVVTERNNGRGPP